MTDKTAPIAQFLGSIQNGLNRLSGKDPESQKPASSDDIVELDVEEVIEQPGRNTKANGPGAPDNESVLRAEREPLTIDVEAMEEQPSSRTVGDRLKGMTKKKKAVLAILVVAVVVGLKNQMEPVAAPELTEALSGIEQDQIPFVDEPQAETAELNAGAVLPETNFAEQGVESEVTPIGFDLNEPIAMAPEKPGPGVEGPVTSEGTSGQPPLSQANNAPGFNLSEPFGEEPIIEPVALKTDADTNATPPPASALPSGPFGDDVPEPKQEVAGFDHGIGGTASSKPDSGKPVLENTALPDEVAGLKAELASRDERLKALEEKLALLEGGTAKTSLSTSPAKPQTLPVQSKASQSVPRTSKAQKVGMAVAAVQPRPNVCVVAFVKAARNCASCVAHAILTVNGAETMIGTGDHIAGYRTSVQGDRLDLQNTNGDVVHKFWSDPDGCRAG